MACPTTRRKAKCDICTFEDGWNKLKLIRCTDCHLYVHKECYGLAEFQKEGSFVCWACQAVGQKFQIDARDTKGQRMEIMQYTRPTRCDLCSVHDGIHAMHPVYDNHGKRGRQLYTKFPGADRHSDAPVLRRRLVWAHSLCAFTLTAQGLMYSCARDGTCNGKGSGDSGDGRSLNPGLVDDEELEEELPVHHFVYYLRRPGTPHSTRTRQIEKSQQELKCCICGLNDRDEKVLRIPVQCCANNEDECVQFRNTHFSLSPGDPCTVAQHVGCAMYGGMNPKEVRRVFYDPRDEADAVQGVYCTLHAEEIDRQEKEETEPVEKLSHRPKQGFPAHPKATRRASNPSSSPLYKKKTLKPTPAPVLPSLLKLAPDKKRRGSGKTATAAVSSTSKKRRSQEQALLESAVDLLGQKLNATKKTKKPKLYNCLSRDEATAVSQLPRPLLATHRKELAHQKSIVHASDAQKILADLIDKVGGQANLTPAMQKTVMKGRKTFWKRKLSDLASDDFGMMWKHAKMELQQYLSPIGGGGGSTTTPATATPPIGQSMLHSTGLSTDASSTPRRSQGASSDSCRLAHAQHLRCLVDEQREASCNSTLGESPSSREQQQQKSSAPPREIVVNSLSPAADKNKPASRSVVAARKPVGIVQPPAPLEGLYPSKPDEMATSENTWTTNVTTIPQL